MAVDCTTCARKNAASSEGHCTEFTLIPELNECAMHSKGAVAQAVAAKPTGTFLWLRDGHTSTTEAPTHPVH